MINPAIFSSGEFWAGILFGVCIGAVATVFVIDGKHKP